MQARRSLRCPSLVNITVSLLLLGSLFATLPARADNHASEQYEVQAGDVLLITVWREEDLTREVLVRPDGRFTFPLAGEVEAKGHAISAIRETLAARIGELIPEPEVTVALSQSRGNKIFVLGKVARPGEFPLTQDLDVMQALALGGGLTTFADADSISILRRMDGEQKALSFDYTDVEYGRKLDQNILLEPGDVVVVP